MQKSLSRIPIRKVEELQIITQHICLQAPIEMVILFGSYARGNWVEEYAEDGIHFQYQSDFDLLVLVETGSIPEQHRLEQKLEDLIDELPNIHTPVSIIVHDIDYVNTQIAQAQYFFSDIKREGVLLYNSSRFKLEKVHHLNPKERYYLAKEDFQYWYDNVKSYYKQYEFAIKEAELLIGAFLLHQLAEKLYKIILLVYTRYKPKTHDLQLLRKLANALEPSLIKVFPFTNKEERHCFDLLRWAYVDSRYNKNYSINSEEINWLGEQVKTLKQLVEMLCQKKIESFNELHRSNQI